MTKNDFKPVVLLVDDSDQDASLFVSALDDVNQDVACQVCSSGKEAEEWLQQGNRADFGLVDVRLGSEDGFKVAGRLARYISEGDKAIILWTGDPEGWPNADKRWALRGKPYDLQALRDLATEIASRAQAAFDQFAAQ
ncbi:MAG: response regulator [Myxococcota bacterium]